MTQRPRRCATPSPNSSDERRADSAPCGLRRRARLRADGRHALRRPGLRDPGELDPGRLPNLTAADLAERFTAAHRRVYFHGGEPGRQVEIVGLRFGVRRRLDALPEFRERPTTLTGPATVPVRVGAETVAAAMVGSSAARCGERRGRRPRADRGLQLQPLGSARLAARRDAPGNIIMRRIAPDDARSGRLRDHQPGADRRRARDGREAGALGLFHRAARGARRLRRAAGRAGQHGGAGRADPDAAWHHRPHLPALRRALSRGDAARRATSSPSTIPIPAASICRTCSCSTRSSSTAR